MSCHICTAHTKPAACFHICPQFIQVHETHKELLNQNVQLHLLACREGARVLHQLCLHHGDPAGQQPPATPAGPVLPAHCILWGVPPTPSHSQKGHCCLWLPLLHLLWHDRVLRQDQHVTATNRLLRPQVCSCFVWVPLAKLMCAGVVTDEVLPLLQARLINHTYH